MTPIQSLVTFSRISWRNIFRNRRRSLITLLSIVIGIASAITLAALAHGISKQMTDVATRNLLGHLQIHHPDYLDDPSIENSFEPDSKFITEIARGAKNWTARLRVVGMISSERKSRPVTVVGIDPTREQKMTFLEDRPVRGKKLAKASDDGVYLGEKLISDLDTEVGRKVVLATQDINGKISERGFRILGAYSSVLEVTEQEFAFVGRDVLSGMVTSVELVSEISAIVENEESLDVLIIKLKELRPDLDISSWLELKPALSAVKSVQDGFLLVWFSIVIISLTFGLVNTLYMSIFERVREFGVLAALGVNRRQIVLTVVMEAVFIVVVGTVIGTTVALWATNGPLADGVNITQFAEGAEKFGIGRVIFPNLLLKDIILANSMIIIISLIGSLVPAYRAGRFSPVKAMRTS